jgi:hypothetical protein
MNTTHQTASVEALRLETTTHIVKGDVGAGSATPLLDNMTTLIAVVLQTHWQTSFKATSDVATEVVNYVTSLVCFLIAADHYVAEEEIVLCSNYLKQCGFADFDQTHIPQFIVAQLEDAGRSLAEVPRFLRALVAHDLQHRTAFAEQALSLLENSGNLIVGIDGVVTDEERQALARVIAVLRTYRECERLNRLR